MRAEFNTVCDVYFGPGTATPGVLKAASIPCRLVSDIYFVDVQAPLSASQAYLTLDALIPDGPTITDLGGGSYTFDYSKSDRIVVATFPLQLWAVLRVESCTWPKPGAPYLRASLAIADDPPIVCSDGYYEQYLIIDYLVAPQFHTLTRTGPTTWEGDGFTLEAETTEPNEECESLWTLTDGTREWTIPDYAGYDTRNGDPVSPNTDPLTLEQVP